MVFSSLKTRRTLIQTKVYYRFFYSIRKETTHKLWKVISSKNLFFGLYVIATACFDKCFLFHMTTGRHCLFFYFLKVSCYAEVLFNRHVFPFFKTSDMKEVSVLFFICTVYNANTKLPKWRSRISYLLIFLNLFYFLMLHIFFFNCF